MNSGRAAYAVGSVGMRLATVCAALLCTIVTAFALTLPALTGRIVDGANIIPAETRRAIEPKLADLETKSGIQLVVATVASLEGQAIEPYANELFRNWKLGEKTKNNGVLLLVAPNERRVRIEVGYGLEGTLTDALSNVIITNAITPRFKAGDFGGGISRGVDHRCVDYRRVGMAAASFVAARQSADHRPDDLVVHCRADRPRHAAHRFSQLSLVVHEHDAKCRSQF
jgi:uncharacterized membrane protein YgcG